MAAWLQLSYWICLVPVVKVLGHTLKGELRKDNLMTLVVKNETGKLSVLACRNN